MHSLEGGPQTFKKDVLRRLCERWLKSSVRYKHTVVFAVCVYPTCLRGKLPPLKRGEGKSNQTRLDNENPGEHEVSHFQRDCHLGLSAEL